MILDIIEEPKVKFLKKSSAIEEWLSRFYVALKFGQGSVKHAKMPPVRSSMLGSGFEIVLKLPFLNFLYVGADPPVGSQLCLLVTPS